MTLVAGIRLGPYEILSPLGAGGMGEVYKARDSRLQRTVAVKVLPSNFPSSAEVRQRFEREVKQLSHPHKRRPAARADAAVRAGDRRRVSW